MLPIPSIRRRRVRLTTAESSSWILVVGTDGLTRDVKIARGVTPVLDQAAIDTVKQWKFTPAAKDGHPVAVQFKVEVSFRLY